VLDFNFDAVSYCGPGFPTLDQTQFGVLGPARYAVCFMIVSSDTPLIAACVTRPAQRMPSIFFAHRARRRGLALHHHRDCLICYDAVLHVAVGVHATEDRHLVIPEAASQALSASTGQSFAPGATPIAPPRSALSGDPIPSWSPAAPRRSREAGMCDTAPLAEDRMSGFGSVWTAVPNKNVVHNGSFSSAKALTDTAILGSAHAHVACQPPQC
jgi:hypothetical protein